MGEPLQPKFLEHGASAHVWDRPGVTATLAADPDVSGDAVDFGPVAVADDVILLTYLVAGERASLRSSVWVRDGRAGWLFRFHQGTRAQATN